MPPRPLLCVRSKSEWAAPCPLGPSAGAAAGGAAGSWGFAKSGNTRKSTGSWPPGSSPQGGSKGRCSPPLPPPPPCTSGALYLVLRGPCWACVVVMGWGRGVCQVPVLSLAPPGLDRLGFLGGGPAIQPSLSPAAPQCETRPSRGGPPEAASRRTLTVTRVNTPKHSPGAGAATAYSALSRRLGCTGCGGQVSLGEREPGSGRAVPGSTGQPAPCEAPLELLSPSGAIPATKPPAPVLPQGQDDEAQCGSPSARGPLPPAPGVCLRGWA